MITPTIPMMNAASRSGMSQPRRLKSEPEPPGDARLMLIPSLSLANQAFWISKARYPPSR